MNQKFDLEIYDFGKKYDLENGWGYFVKGTNCTNCVLNYVKRLDNYLLLSKVYLSQVLGKNTLEEGLIDSLKNQEIKEIWGVEQNMDIADDRCYERTFKETLEEFHSISKKRGYKIKEVYDKTSRGSKL